MHHHEAIRSFQGSLPKAARSRYPEASSPVVAISMVAPKAQAKAVVTTVPMSLLRQCSAPAVQAKPALVVARSLGQANAGASAWGVDRQATSDATTLAATRSEGRWLTAPVGSQVGLGPGMPLIGKRPSIPGITVPLSQLIQACKPERAQTPDVTAGVLARGPKSKMSAIGERPETPFDEWY